mmetsp:Transcript_18343/g.29496  ORF Transcript_18343/g.29496 Transcript_18343/m.29496 type:complete len:114 (-) Transcript_18343:15375-15716(-)
MSNRMKRCLAIRVLLWHGGARSRPVTFVLREPEPGQQAGDGRVVHLYTLCVGLRITQLAERDIGALCNQILRESLMRGEFALAARRALRGGFRLAARSACHFALVARWSKSPL